LTPEAQARLERNRLFQWGEPAAEVRPAPQPGQPGPGDFLKTRVEVPQRPAFVPPPQVPPADPPRVTGVIVGYSLAHYRYKDHETGENREVELLKPGDDVFIATVGASGVKPVSGTFVVADYFRSEMSEYDSSYVYVPIDELQRMRGMDGRVNALQLKLKGDLADDGPYVRDQLIPEVQSLFPPTEVRVVSWQQHQGPLLAAIDIERGILNLLLFMIVGVAGFSVLAIFSMIVSEKYRDIGVLKSLGASSLGVMGIFLGYGLLLAVIGCALGTGAGLLITENINEIEGWLTRRTGQQIFDRSVYYFDRIPTNVEPLAVALINLGAIGTAVLFSILPAWRAARLHPVRALRFE
jgi:lipoprotein-releasing system permease protein